MNPQELSQECRALLLYVSNVSFGQEGAVISNGDVAIACELEAKGLLKYRAGSERWSRPPSSAVLTAAGRHLAKRIRGDAGINDQNSN